MSSSSSSIKAQAAVTESVVAADLEYDTEPATASILKRVSMYGGQQQLQQQPSATGGGGGGEGMNSSTTGRMRRAKSKRFSILFSTEDFNQCDEEFETPEFYGPYRHLKKDLDYEYHSYYRQERQWLHDSIIDDYLCHEEQAKNCIPAEPWLIFTCGVKGSGKRHTTQALMEDGRLPLLSTIIVDADEIRRTYLPEFTSYVESNPELVSRRMNKEAGYISELLTLAALQAGDNVVLDGTIEDVDWHLRQCAELRQKHPKLRIALLHVTAPLEVILERVEEKAKETGLHIPKERTVQTLEELPANIEAVKSGLDYFCTIHNAGGGGNNGDDDFELKDASWESFTKTFSQEVEVVKAVPDATTTNKAMKAPTTTGRAIPVRGIPRQLTTRRFASTEETQNCAKSFRDRRRSLRKPFCVDVSTEDNHRSFDSNYYGKYSHIRKTLDYDYHGNYTEQRQRFQDSIVSEFLHSAVVTDKDGNMCTTPTKPWLVFTAGAMGAGKSYTMRNLVDNGRFPLIAFITVDPDQIRRHLPEYHVYVDSNPELAGDLTHKEAGFIAEILTLAGLQAGKNVMVDGSLRNADWYKIYFQRLRKDFPVLRIGIIHVTAPREAIFQRAAERAIFTGRVVPQKVLVMAIEQVPKSVKILGPLVDYFVELQNNPGTSDILLNKEGETWMNFSSQWIQACAWVPSSKKQEKLIRRTENASTPTLA